MNHRIIGAKYRHDSCIALIEDGELKFSTELEKINNGARYKQLDNISELENAMRLSGHKFLNDKTTFVIDGHRNHEDPNADIGYLKKFDLSVAGYSSLNTDGHSFGEEINSFNRPYRSYSHVLGHIIGAYVTAPFSGTGIDPANVVVFDGGQKPTMYHVNPKFLNPVMKVSELAQFHGVIYGIMGLYFGPFQNEAIVRGTISHHQGNKFYGGFDVPGKLMAYIGNDGWDYELVERIKAMYDALVRNGWGNKFRGELEHKLMKMINMCDLKLRKELSDACILHSIHRFIQNELIAGINRNSSGIDLIFTGGSALNIKWNSAIRDRCHFKGFWVPPFPNDSGCAIGAAACEMALVHDHWKLKWNVYCGLDFIINTECLGVPTSPEDLGVFLAFNPDTPVLALHGKAEVGPRSLGHRSILMNPQGVHGKELLNKIKCREGYRPIAPICLESDAQKFFNPGSQDKYMLFDHMVYADHADKIPAVIHVDDTARLQTVSDEDCETTYRILKGFQGVAEFGILCNTSANFSGTGFLPDLISAKVYAKENGIKHIWTNKILMEV